MTKMRSNKVYLFRAFYDWIVDSQCTPYLLIKATDPKVSVPRAFVKEGKIILDVSPGAIFDFKLTPEAVSFTAQFGGVRHSIYLPMYSISALYAKENGEGVMFPEEEKEGGEKAGELSEGDTTQKKRKTHLRIVE